MIDLNMPFKNLICCLLVFQRINPFKPLHYGVELLIIGIIKLWILYLNARLSDHKLDMDVIDKRKLGRSFGEMGKR